MLTGVSMVHVPYRGAGPAGLLLPPLSAAIEYVKTGKLRALAVTTATRSEALADLPTTSEFVPDYEASNWYGIGAPSKTPAEIVGKLNKETNAVLADQRMRARIADLGETILGGSTADTAKQIAAETDKWAKVVKFANIKVD
jgi:tripartite-type tricarboxylate transporter receptor subunit TctC